MVKLMLSNIVVKGDILSDPKFSYLFTVDAVNALVMEGVAFRDAYKIVGNAKKKSLYELLDVRIPCFVKYFLGCLPISPWSTSL